MAAQIEAATGLSVELIRGGGGIFDIRADGMPVYLKSQGGGFPSDEVVIDRLKGMQK